MARCHGINIIWIAIQKILTSHRFVNDGVNAYFSNSAPDAVFRRFKQKTRSIQLLLFGYYSTIFKCN